MSEGEQTADEVVDRPQEAAPPTNGVLAGRYRLGPLLGAGGMGIVRRATDELLDRSVAIKLLADNLAADPSARERFLREARAAARVVDPHVVAVFDVGEDGGRPYLVMELVDGPSLAGVLSMSGPLAPDQVAQVAADALAALARAHGAGLLHRDVKPGNLLLAPDGTVKMTDFGVAQAADAPGLTRTGFVMGTGAYLAPERRQGRPATVATDLYALGVTCVQLLHGTTPAPGRPLHLRPGTPAPLATLLHALVAPDPAQRPTDASEARRLLGPVPRTAIAAPPTPGHVTSGQDTAGAGDVPPADVPTQPIAPAPGPASPPSDEAVHDVPTDARDRGPDTATPDRRAGRGWLTGIVAAVLLAVPLVAVVLLGGPTTADEDRTPGGVERVEGDPVRTVENLADWLRAQSD